MGFLEGLGIVVALDTLDLDLVRRVVESLSGFEGVSAYKIGSAVALAHGLVRVVDLVKSLSSAPVIYDHQKAMTDVPHTAGDFARILRISGVDAAIGFPLSGPGVLASWVEALRGEGVVPIVGGEMTHEGFLRGEGGYVCDDSPERIYRAASDLRVSHYVVPGNMVERSSRYSQIVRERVARPVFLSPGFSEDPRSLGRLSKILGPSFHAIVGRAVLRAGDPLEAVRKLYKALEGRVV